MAKLMATYTVKPAKETPGGYKCLSECDQIKTVTHAATIYFYPPGNLSLETAADILRNSLSEALTIFYPLAGRLHSIDGGGRLKLHCNAAGALLVAVESEAKIDDFGDFGPTPEIRALIPSVDYNKPIDELPLLVVQVTKFSCGGLSLGLGISHILVDGLSALNFISEWAKIARGEGPGCLPPFFDRSVFRPPEHMTAPVFDHPNFGPQPLLIGQKDDVEERKKETSVLVLKLSKVQTEKLKEKANEDENVSNGGRPYTRYEAVAGHIWRTACKARQHEANQPTSLYIAVDARNRMEPPLPPRYFGNAVFRITAESTSGELVSKSLGYASGKVRQAIEKATPEYLQSCLVFLKNQKDVTKFRNFHTVGCSKGAFYGNPSIEITSWARLPVYGADFGWGREIYMGPGDLGYDGKVFLIPEQGLDGSFFVPLMLQVRHIDAFHKFIYQDI